MFLWNTTMSSNVAPKPLALIVEDEALVALAMEDVLRNSGFDVVLAATKQEAIHYDAHIFTILIVDLCLNGELSGQHIIRVFRCIIPQLPLIVVTGFHADAPQASLHGLGAPIARLHKPDHLDALVPAAWTAIHQAEFGVHWLPSCSSE